MTARLDRSAYTGPMQMTRRKLQINIAISLALGVLTGSGFVALHFPAESESFHLSQIWESVALSILGVMFWLCLCQTAAVLQAFSVSSPKKLKLAWYAALLASLGLGFVVAGFIGYSAFMGDERDWFKTHDRFVLADYITGSIELGLFYGLIAAAALAGIASTLIGVLALIKRRYQRSTAVG